MSTPKISCVIGTYNEEARITCALTHALQWADEVIIVDKSSTDKTPEIAARMGARVVTVPWSPQGHERVTETMQLPANDWVFFFTAGEIPSRGLIAAMKEAVDTLPDLALIMVPVAFFSFGINNPRSVWRNNSQFRAIHRRRASISNTVHANFGCDPANRIIIPMTQGCYLLHQTHATVADFVRSHVDYMSAEAAGAQDLNAKLAEAREMITANEANFSAHPEIEIHAHAWKLYWHGVALHCMEALAGGPTAPIEYLARAERVLAREWATISSTQTYENTNTTAA